jgi:hypothetical protein
MATNKQCSPGLCDQCAGGGLPILLARYAVVPKTVRVRLSYWASGDKVKDIPIGYDFHYALRTLREGYVYLFYSKNARGSNRWECYSVGQDGCLRLQPTPATASPQTDPEFSCCRAGHSNTSLHYIVIEQPDKCGATWIAFSETKWSDETIKEYTTDEKLRDERMQILNPADMAKGTKHSHGALADVRTLQSVIEYAPSFTEDQLPHNPVANDFTWEDGHYVSGRIEKTSTRYPWHLRQGQAEFTVKHMKARASTPEGALPSHILALWDGIGIAHELNGFRNDAAGWIKKYGDERELQITAYNAIEGAKRAIRDEATAFTAQTQRIFMSESNFKDVMRTRPNSRGWPTDVRYKRLTDPDDLAHYGRGMVEVFPPGFEERRAAAIRRAGDETVANSWPKYEERLDRKKAMEPFKQAWDEMLTRAGDIVDQRTQALVNWLEAPLFIDTLKDFHPDSDIDCVRFEDAVGEAVFGMGSSACGQKKIDQWINEATASIDKNLIWRTIALNQQEGIAEVDAALKIAYGNKIALNGENWKKAAAGVKWNKIADLGKKSLTLYNTQSKATYDATSGIAPVKNTRGLEKLLMTVGGRWLKPFSLMVDTVNELVLRYLLLMRCAADSTAAKALAEWDADHSSMGWQRLLRGLKTQGFQPSPEAWAEQKKDAAKWSDLRKNVEVPDAKKENFNAARDARLALIVAVFEAFNLAKTSAKAGQEPGNEKIQAQLTAAKYATTAAAIDVLSNFVKGVAAVGDKAVSYQALKFGGGALSVVASWYGAALDFEDAKSAGRHGDYRMAVLFGIRGTFQATGGLLTGLTALSYCSPLIATFGKRFGERMAGRALIGVAEWLVFGRAALLLAGMEVSIFVLFVSGVIAIFDDDALQTWCDRCAFGVRRKELPDSYTDAERQLKAYAEALKGVV